MISDAHILLMYMDITFCNNATHSILQYTMCIMTEHYMHVIIASYKFPTQVGAFSSE